MSQVIHINTIEKSYGKIQAKSNMSTRRRNGKTFTYTWDPMTPEKITPRKVLMQYTMKLANLQAKAIMQDPEQKAEYEKLLANDKKYKELRAFVVAKCMERVKSAAENGDAEVIGEMLQMLYEAGKPDCEKQAKIDALRTFLPESSAEN